MPKKKASPLLTVFSVVVGALLGAGCSILMCMQVDALTEGFSLTVRLMGYCVMLWGLLAVILLQTVLHEAGHLIFGLMTGYRFVSFRIGRLMLLRTPDGLKFRRHSLAGTGGQCLMSPPGDLGHDMPCMLYHLGGVIINLLSAVLFGIAYLLWKDIPLLSALLLTSALLALFSALINGIPMRGLVNNDGRNALDLREDDAARRSLWIQLSVNARVAQGQTILDMPEDWFTMPTDEAMRNSMIAPLGAFRSDYLMAKGDFAAAAALQDHLLEGDNALVPLYRTLLTSERIFCGLMIGTDPERLQALRTPAWKKSAAALKNQPAIARTDYACALLLDRDPTAANKALVRFERCTRNFPYPAEVETERRYTALAYERAQSPDPAASR